MNRCRESATITQGTHTTVLVCNLTRAHSGFHRHGGKGASLLWRMLPNEVVVETPTPAPAETPQLPLAMP